MPVVTVTHFHLTSLKAQLQARGLAREAVHLFASLPRLTAAAYSRAWGLIDDSIIDAMSVLPTALHAPQAALRHAAGAVKYNLAVNALGEALFHIDIPSRGATEWPSDTLDKEFERWQQQRSHRSVASSTAGSGEGSARNKEHREEEEGGSTLEEAGSPRSRRSSGSSESSSNNDQTSTAPTLPMLRC